jgi:hypothetical protein
VFLIKRYKQKYSIAKLKQSKGCACETPNAEIFFFPGNGARKMLDCDAVLMKMTAQLGTPRGRYDEHNSKFFPQLRNRGLSKQ